MANIIDAATPKWPEFPHLAAPIALPHGGGRVVALYAHRNYKAVGRAELDSSAVTVALADPARSGHLMDLLLHVEIRVATCGVQYRTSCGMSLTPAGEIVIEFLNMEEGNAFASDIWGNYVNLLSKDFAGDCTPAEDGVSNFLRVLFTQLGIDCLQAELEVATHARALWAMVGAAQELRLEANFDDAWEARIGEIMADAGQ